MALTECICPVGAQLGEGPVWLAEARTLWFVDIKGRRIHRCDERGGELRSWSTAEDVGFLAPAADGTFVCGLRSGLHRFDPRSDTFSLIARVDSDRPRNRLNDACVDAAGRLWFGTMDDDERRPSGALYRFDERGLQCCDEGYVITNGPAVSPDGRTLYHVDTLQRSIYAFDLARDGALSNRRVFARVGVEGAWPDGPSVDAAGCVWVGLFGGWGLQRYAPGGELLETVRLPVANCTKACFGGEDLRTLYVTTAWKGLSEQQRAQQPLAGGLFSMRVDTPGLPQHRVTVVP
ncbi:MAG TPA: SMP-30/gluconolactonase/LRE family protein [Steroidobacteraceae bacterium]|nr:SMP-30/gluconolactonase/LRE family protein [Steroidobacteraceae bacterium]